MTAQEGYLTVAQAAVYLSVPSETVCEAIDQGLLRATNMADPAHPRYLIARSDILLFLIECFRTTTKGPVSCDPAPVQEGDDLLGKVEALGKSLAKLPLDRWVVLLETIEEVMDQPANEWLTVKQAAIFAGLSQRQVRIVINKGILPASDISSATDRVTLRIARNDLIDWLRRGSIGLPAGQSTIVARTHVSEWRDRTQEPTTRLTAMVDRVLDSLSKLRFDELVLQR